MPSIGRINPWLRRYHPAPQAPVRLVYFPHAGGSASSCFQLSAALPPAVELVAVQYPGRQDRFAEPRIDSISELADEIPQWLDIPDGKPTAFFGHSMGAILAYEVTRRLQAADLVSAGALMPTRLIVSGRRAPSIVRDGEQAVHLMDDDGLIADLRALQGTDDSIFDDIEVRRLVLPVVRADYCAVGTYKHVPGPPLTCPVTAVIGDSDPKVSPAEADAWRQHTTGAFSLRVFPGGHFYLGEGALAVADLVRDELAARV